MSQFGKVILGQICDIRLLLPEKTMTIRFLIFFIIRKHPSIPTNDDMFMLKKNIMQRKILPPPPPKKKDKKDKQTVNNTSCCTHEYWWSRWCGMSQMLVAWFSGHAHCTPGTSRACADQPACILGAALSDMDWWLTHLELLNLWSHKCKHFVRMGIEVIWWCPWWWPCSYYQVMCACFCYIGLALFLYTLYIFDLNKEHLSKHVTY